jgi:transposase-like protein
MTGEVKGLAGEWRTRPLEPFCPVIFFDALRVNIRDRGRISKKAVYPALAIRLDGQKKLRAKARGLWIEKNEGSKFWMGIMNGLKNRGGKRLPYRGGRRAGRVSGCRQRCFPRHGSPTVYGSHGQEFGEIRAV